MDDSGDEVALSSLSNEQLSEIEGILDGRIEIARQREDAQDPGILISSARILIIAVSQETVLRYAQMFKLLGEKTVFSQQRSAVANLIQTRSMHVSRRCLARGYGSI